jgi:hypothetical protein
MCALRLVFGIWFAGTRRKIVTYETEACMGEYFSCVPYRKSAQGCILDTVASGQVPANGLL